jgi:uncharacterized repeat protein (TIGR01451 family)
MSVKAHHESSQLGAVLLPRWWRYVLIALATVILCSCSAPAVQIARGAEPTEQMSLRADASVTWQNSDAPECVHDCPSCDNPHGTYGADPYGAVVGPSDEYLCDGGDFGTPAGVRADWNVEGVDEEDAIGHYDTVDGRTVVTPSNRVCIYAPRFAAVRRVVSAMAHEQPVFVSAVQEEQLPARAVDSVPPITSLQWHALGIYLGQRPPSLFRQRQQAGGLENLQAAMDAYASLGAYANLEIVRTGEVSAAERPLIDKARQAAVTWAGDQAPQVLFGVKAARGLDSIKQAGVVYQTDERDSPRLRLLKLASCGHALPGEEIEFTLRYDNVGDQVIGNVTVVDNLSTRLEYIAGSAKSSVDANFRAEPTPNGSSILRWEITPSVKPGEGGVLRFRVRVR